jgi:ABC-type uncharacterized transport system substrate-binding protein
LVALAPDVILATGSSSVPPLLQASRSVPIVFTATADPVGIALAAWDKVAQGHYRPAARPDR